MKLEEIREGVRKGHYAYKKEFELLLEEIDMRDEEIKSISQRLNAAIEVLKIYQDEDSINAIASIREVMAAILPAKPTTP